MTCQEAAPLMSQAQFVPTYLTLVSGPGQTLVLTLLPPGFPSLHLVVALGVLVSSDPLPNLGSPGTHIATHSQPHFGAVSSWLRIFVMWAEFWLLQVT